MSEEISQKELRPKVTAVWVKGKWDIKILDEDGRKELDPRMKNLLIQQLKRQLKQRYRELRIRSRAEKTVILGA